MAFKWTKTTEGVSDGENFGGIRKSKLATWAVGQGNITYVLFTGNFLFLLQTNRVALIFVLFSFFNTNIRVGFLSQQLWVQYF